ncbi:MAG: hypothetical protein AB1758_04660 [Candidatus Eremiobacterota bacterium]
MKIAPLLPGSPPPTRTPDEITVMMLPQDTLVCCPEAVLIPREQLGQRLSGPRLRVQDDVPVAQADERGDYRLRVGSDQFDQVNASAVVARTLLTYERYMGHSTPWAFDGPLTVNPHAGEGKTAYYSRWDDSINFCQWNSPSLHKVVKTSESPDVIAHETGHAILDGIRPSLGWGTEPAAFHEGFGDSSAVLHALQYDTNLDKILAENGGDFSRPSLVSRLAEEFGTAFNREDQNPNNDDHPYYRTALNEFRYKNPRELPSDSYPPSLPEEVLSSEPHSFSRVWSGTFYALVGALYHQCAPEAATPRAALIQAREALGPIWGRSLDHLPASNLKFRDAALAMLREAARFQEGKYFDTMATVLVDRNLLSREEADQARQPVPDVRLAGPVGSQFEAQQALESLREQLGLPGLAWQADRPLAGADGRQVLLFRAPERVEVELAGHGPVELELSSSLQLTFDRDGRLVSQSFRPVAEEDRQDARGFARKLAAEGRVAAGDQAFQDRDGSGRPFKARVVPQVTGLPRLEQVPVWD